MQVCKNSTPFGVYCRESELASRQGRVPVSSELVVPQDTASISSDKPMGPSPPFGKAIALIFGGAATGAATLGYLGATQTGHPVIGGAIGAIVGGAAGLFLGAKTADHLLS